MEVLIVGGSGFIGRNLIEGAPKNWKIRATYCSSTDFEEFAKKNNVEAIKLDLTKNEIPNLGDADAVIYLPAVGPGQLKDNPDIAKYTCILGSDGINKVVNAMGKIGKLIYTSSGVVYLRNNNSDYRKSRLIGEGNVLGVYREKGINYVILRNMEIYGKYMAPHKIYRKFMKACIEGEKSFKVSGNGNNLLDTMYISDYIEGLIAVINSNKVNVIVDYGRGKPVTLKELAKTVAEVCGNRDFKLECSGQATEDTRFAVNNEDFFKVFGVRAKTELAEGLKKWKDEGLL